MKTIGNMPNLSMGLANGALVQDIQEFLFFSGKAYSFEDYLTFGNDETKTIIVDPTCCPDSKITFLPLCSSATAGPVLIDFFSNSLAGSDGTLLGTSNRRIGFDAAKTTLRLNPAISNIGNRFAGDLIPASGSSPPLSAGTANQQTLRFELSTLIKYAIQIKNTNGANTIVLLKLTWFEE